MSSQTDQNTVKKQLEDRLKELPKVIRDAIVSADVEKRLRVAANRHQLHVDQWNMLENEVMLALLGFQPTKDLETNIRNEVGVTDDIARSLAEDINKIIFEPIREELERSLGHPQAQEKEVSDVEKVREAVLAGSESPKHAEPASPGTPPPPVPSEKATRGPSSGAYVPGEASTVRKNIIDDPYRETPE